MVSMGGFSLVEQIKQETGEIPVQMPVEVAQKPRNKRSIEAKVGRQKYHEVVTKKIEEQNEQILLELRWIRHRLKVLGESDVDMPMLQRYAVCDQVDLDIMDRVYQAGDLGVFPKDIAAALPQFKLKYYDVSRRIVRMNKRLKKEAGELLFEKRGHRWALTRFAFDVYGAVDVANVSLAAGKLAAEEGA
jgi:hypothetical protein